VAYKDKDIPNDYIVRQKVIRVANQPSSGQKNNQDCFFVTATFGTPYEVQVWRYRNFRDKYLANSFLGKLLIKLYYFHTGKFLARIVDNNSLFKAASRALLLRISKILPKDC